MIFSLSEEVASIKLDAKSDTYYLCFFQSANSIHCPQLQSLKVLLTSLKLKKNVLVLSSNIQELPLISTTKRWEVGDFWLWIEPRAYRYLQEHAEEIGTTFVSMKNFLTHHK